MSGEQDKSKEKTKKKFISERIVGRELTRTHAFKYLLLAIGCGILIGVFAALAFWVVSSRLPVRKEAGETAAQESEEQTGQQEDETEEGEKTQEEGETGSDQEEGEKPSQEEETEPAPGMTEDQVARLVQREIASDQLTEKDLSDLLQLLRDTISEARHSVVSVQAVHRDTGWFNDTIETSRLAAGVVLSAEEPEILILTTDTAVENADMLHVIFSDGSMRDAYVKQSTAEDGIAVIGVSLEGLAEALLSEITPVRIAYTDPQEEGMLLIAVGAPLGVSYSTDIGLLGYFSEEEQTADGTQNCFYTNAASDADRGTFFLNVRGEMVGMASGADETQMAEAKTRAVSASYLRRILSSLSEGKPIPYLGIKGRTVSLEMQAQQIPAGIYVTEAETDSPAYNAGIKNGDVVTAINETEILDMESFERAVSELEAGTEAAVAVMRSSGSKEYREMSFTVTVGTR